MWHVAVASDGVHEPELAPTAATQRLVGFLERRRGLIVEPRGSTRIGDGIAGSRASRVAGRRAAAASFFASAPPLGASPSCSSTACLGNLANATPDAYGQGQPVRVATAFEAQETAGHGEAAESHSELYEDLLIYVNMGLLCILGYVLKSQYDAFKRWKDHRLTLAEAWEEVKKQESLNSQEEVVSADGPRPPSGSGDGTVPGRGRTAVGRNFGVGAGRRGASRSGAGTSARGRSAEAKASQQHIGIDAAQRAQAKGFATAKQSAGQDAARSTAPQAHAAPAGAAASGGLGSSASATDVRATSAASSLKIDPPPAAVATTTQATVTEAVFALSAEPTAVVTNIEATPPQSAVAPTAQEGDTVAKTSLADALSAKDAEKMPAAMTAEAAPTQHASAAVAVAEGRIVTSVPSEIPADHDVTAPAAPAEDIDVAPCSGDAFALTEPSHKLRADSATAGGVARASAQALSGDETASPHPQTKPVLVGEGSEAVMDNQCMDPDAPISILGAADDVAPSAAVSFAVAAPVEGTFATTEGVSSKAQPALEEGVAKEALIGVDSRMDLAAPAQRQDAPIVAAGGTFATETAASRAAESAFKPTDVREAPIVGTPTAAATESGEPSAEVAVGTVVSAEGVAEGSIPAVQESTTLAADMAEIETNAPPVSKVEAPAIRAPEPEVVASSVSGTGGSGQRGADVAVKDAPLEDTSGAELETDRGVVEAVLPDAVFATTSAVEARAHIHDASAADDSSTFPTDVAEAVEGQAAGGGITSAIGAIASSEPSATSSNAAPSAATGGLLAQYAVPSMEEVLTGIDVPPVSAPVDVQAKVLAKQPASAPAASAPSQSAHDVAAADAAETEERETS